MTCDGNNLLKNNCIFRLNATNLGLVKCNDNIEPQEKNILTSISSFPLFIGPDGKMHEVKSQQAASGLHQWCMEWPQNDLVQYKVKSTICMYSVLLVCLSPKFFLLPSMTRCLMYIMYIQFLICLSCLLLGWAVLIIKWSLFWGGLIPGVILR